jgi:hypothetical protein
MAVTTSAIGRSAIERLRTCSALHLACERSDESRANMCVSQKERRPDLEAKWRSGDKMARRLNAASPSDPGWFDDVRRKTQDLLRVNKTNNLGTAFSQESCSQYAPNAQLTRVYDVKCITHSTA